MPKTHEIVQLTRANERLRAALKSVIGNAAPVSGVDLYQVEGRVLRSAADVLNLGPQTTGNENAD